MAFPRRLRARDRRYHRPHHRVPRRGHAAALRWWSHQLLQPVPDSDTHEDPDPDTDGHRDSDTVDADTDPYPYLPSRYRCGRNDEQHPASADLCDTDPYPDQCTAVHRLCFMLVRFRNLLGCVGDSKGRGWFAGDGTGLR